ncbi:MAG TPA: TonB-dependent receptor [Steroidobacteraceae bacterium]|nr:TonB-dependent receptor [Steroidobacteraceae bacterium]
MRRRHDSEDTRALKKTVTLAGAALLALAGAVGTAPAQEQKAEQTEATEAPSGALQEVTVTATRHEESLSKVPLSITALTQEALDDRGIKDFTEIARFTPGVNFDNSGTNNISIRGISSTGGAGTTGIYLDDTPIQMRALAFNPDEALPKSFDIDRVEVLRGPQGTLFGAGSEGGTVRYLTTQPSLTKTTSYGRFETSYTEYGTPNYEAGAAIGGPLVTGTLGGRFAASFRDDGGWINRIDPTTLDTVQKNANYVKTWLLRGALLWAPNEHWSLTPGIYYQNQDRNDINNYWPIYSNPSSGSFLNADPSQRETPDKFYLASLKIQGDVGSNAQLISNTAYYHREEQTGYEGTLYNLGFYQAQPNAPGATPVIPLSSFLPGVFPMLSATGVHLPAGALDYRSPSSINNGQMNISEEIRLQSTDPAAKLIWTTGIFVTVNRQQYLEQIHDPQLSQLITAATGIPGPGTLNIPDIFTVYYDPTFPQDSYFLMTYAQDKQYAWFGEGTYSLTDRLKLTAGLRVSSDQFYFNTLTGGPQLFGPTRTGNGSIGQTATTPKVSLQFQADPQDLYYATYAKGFRPGGANNPIPYAACQQDFINFGIPGAPQTYSSDTVNSYEIGAKNNFDNRVRIASSIYYIKWNNIQQTVIPPICEISFIANLGQAVAKGADLQAEIAATDHLSLELAAGYTDARYTAESRLSPTEQNPVVANGDAITGQSSETGGGQPTAPYTITGGVEYRFSAFAHQAFVRADAEYEARAKWLIPGNDPSTLQYDPANFVLPGTTFVSMRSGLDLGEWSVSGFVDNLTNAHPVVDFNNTICAQPGVTLPGQSVACQAGPQGSRLLREYTFRPRTFGITAIWRK